MTRARNLSKLAPLWQEAARGEGALGGGEMVLGAEAVDVFYVQTDAGAKVTDGSAQKTIAAALTEAAS